VDRKDLIALAVNNLPQFNKSLLRKQQKSLTES